MISENVDLNKVRIILFLFLISSFLGSEDLIIADEFEEGDLLSSETFNQIFDTIERINRKIKDSDLFGTWSCSAMKMADGSEANLPFGWTNKDGLAYEITGIQVNFTQTVSGTTSGVNAISTSAPNPFFLDSPIQNRALNGNYLLKNNKIVIKSQAYNSGGSTSYSRSAYSAEFLSPTRLLLTDDDESITCDVASGVPASPTGPIAVNAKTSIDLSWIDTSDNESGFKIYRKPDGSTEFTLLSTLTVSNYSDFNTAEGIGYSYYIVSYNDKGESGKSKVVSATLDSIDPTIVNVSPQNGDEIKLANFPPIVITFSEAIQIICPEEYKNSTPDYCSVGNAGTISTGTPAGPYGFLNVGEKNEVIVTSYPLPGYTGSNLTFTVTISKDFIHDMNGNQLQEDYSWQFTNND